MASDEAHDRVDEREALRQSERQAADYARALRESEERYRILVETCPDGITVTNLEGKLLMTNQQAANIQGYASPQELIAAAPDAFQLIAPEDRERAYENARRAFETGSIRRIEYSVLRKDGSRAPVELNVSLITDEHGAPRAFMGVTRDITERKRAEAEREQLQARVQHAQKLESLGMLAGGIAHDFNNLLVGILGSASMALPALGPDADTPVRRHLEQIEAAALRARELTEQLLAYAGKTQLYVRPVDLTELVEEMAELLSLTVSKKAELVCDLAPDLPAVEGDATQLRQVVMNLITNASEALGAGAGTITLRTRVTSFDPDEPADAFVADRPAPGPYVVLEVSDSGCGMDAELVDKLFDPFFTTKFTGRGLGLSAVLGIVRSHHGSIAVNTAPDQGTLIRVLLPPTDKPAASLRPAQPRELTTPTGTGTILVVDDEPAVRAVLRSMLTTVGYDVVLAENGERGIEHFRESPDRFAAIVLDATMPKMDGGEASQELRRIRPGVPIVFSSGFTEQEVAERIALGTYDGFIQKPYRMPELLSLLDRILQRR